MTAGDVQGSTPAERLAFERQQQGLPATPPADAPGWDRLRRLLAATVDRSGVA